MSLKIQVRCSNCEVKIRVASRLLGEKAKCPACGGDTILEADSRAHQRPILNGRFQSTSLGLDQNHDLERATDGNSGQQTAPDSSTRPRMLGKYRLVRRIGRGGFGEVWEAYDTRLFRKVAIKLPIFSPDDEKRIQRFLTEGKAASRLHHPNIVSIFDAGVIGQQHFLAMEFVDGISLDELAHKNKFEHRQSADLLCKLAQAFDYAHGCGIVHRDIKPQNIVIHSTGQPQIVDFGLARILELDTHQTVEGTLLGTPAFMAPEQARGAIAEIGPHTDQYTLGVLMYWLLAGRQPYEGPYTSIITQVINSSPLPLNSLCADLDPRLESICQKAMSKDVEDRYVSCAQMADDLDRYLRDESVSTYHIPLATRTRRWFRRNPLEGWLSVSTAAMLVIGLMVSTSAWLRTSYLASADSLNIVVADQKLMEAKQAEHERHQELANANEVRQKVQLGRQSLESQNAVIKQETAEVERLRSENEALTSQLEEQIATLLTTQQELTTASQRNVQLEEIKVNVELTGVSAIDSAVNAIVAQNWARASVSLRSIPRAKRDGVWRILAEAARQRKVIPEMKQIVRHEGIEEWGIELTGRYLRLRPARDNERWIDLHSGVEIASFDSDRRSGIYSPHRALDGSFYMQYKSGSGTTYAFSPHQKRLYGYAGDGNLVYVNSDGTKASFHTDFQVTDIAIGPNGDAVGVARRLLANRTRKAKKGDSGNPTDILLLSLEDGGPNVIWSLRNDVLFQRTVTSLEAQFPDAKIQFALHNGRGIEIKETLLGTSEEVMLQMVVEFPHMRTSDVPYAQLEVGRDLNTGLPTLLGTTAATNWIPRDHNKSGWRGRWGECGRVSSNTYLEKLFSAGALRESLRERESGVYPTQPATSKPLRNRLQAPAIISLLPGEQHVLVCGGGIIEVFHCPTSITDP